MLRLKKLCANMRRAIFPGNAPNDPCYRCGAPFDWSSRMTNIGRRQFITLLGGAAAAWPVAARAQQGSRPRRIGIIPPTTPGDSETQARLAAFRQSLEQLGWQEGRDVRFEYRWPGGNAELFKTHAAELVAAAPDVILCGITPVVQALKHETQTIPIVFANVADPVASGLVASIAKPGGNVTGFTAVEHAIVGKWLELLKEIAPAVARVALIGNPEVVFTRGFRAALEAASPSFGVTPIAAEVRNATDIERAIELFAREPAGGLLVVPEFTPSVHRATIFRMASHHRLPAVYPFRFYAADGGLASYGPDQVDQYRRAAGYVDRILRGAKPADLPVQAPTKFELVINLKTAKALGLDVPPILLARADEVIE
jgi:putative ABC transport system substrate-binding protein